MADEKTIEVKAGAYGSGRAASPGDQQTARVATPSVPEGVDDGTADDGDGARAGVPVPRSSDGGDSENVEE